MGFRVVLETGREVAAPKGAIDLDGFGIAEAMPRYKASSASP